MEYNLVHDLTIAFLEKTPEKTTPEEFVKEYFAVLPQISAAVESYNGAQGNGTANVVKRPSGL